MTYRSRRVATLATPLAVAFTLGLSLLTVLSSPVAAAIPDAPRPGSPGGARSTEVAEIPISFTVDNVNRSQVACASDGQRYLVRGHLVGPADLLRERRVDVGTLYLHGLSFGEFFYRYQGDRRRDYAVEQAARGNVSVVVDRLGYGASDKPDGRQVCVGSRADMAHQMVQALRRGDYRTDRGRAPRLRHVVLAGHSYGGQIAQVAAYSFGDIDGLVVLGYADRVQSDLLKLSAAYAAQVCATGGLAVGATGPAGYAPFGPPAGAPAALFSSTPARVQSAVSRVLTIDPCGDTASFEAATAQDLQRVGSIDVPVLVVAGGADKLFPRPAADDQGQLFTGSDSVTTKTLRRTAHAFTFERGRDRLVRVVDRWLDRELDR